MPAEKETATGAARLTEKLWMHADEAQAVLRKLRPEAETAQLAHQLSAFSNPTRMRLAALLHAAPQWGISTGDLVVLSGVEQSVVSRVLGRMRKTGMIESRTRLGHSEHSLTRAGRRLLDAVFEVKAG